MWMQSARRVSSSILPLRSTFARSYHYAGKSLPVNTILRVVPQQEQWIIERFGRYAKTLGAGLHLLIPFADRIRYVHSMKEIAFEVPDQTAITKDNVVIRIDGVLYLRVMDSYLASYAVSNPIFAISQLAQTTMRSEIGKLSLDSTFEEREQLNMNIVEAIKPTGMGWGMDILRYEIRDIQIPDVVRHAMDLQAEAERQKRKQILQSEGERQSDVNIAEGRKRATVLRSEAEMEQNINFARGEAESIRLRAKALAEGIQLVAQELQTSEGKQAVSARLAELYIGEFGQIARRSNTVVIPSSVSDIAGVVGAGMSIFESLRGKFVAETSSEASTGMRVVERLDGPTSANVPNKARPTISQDDQKLLREVVDEIEREGSSSEQKRGR